ncbi:hypothetical protein [Plantactinospora sp. B24E8]|uniref:hypothetical protein n=1 Tax=Plantactinospora sp. B24E8 TaxID=3153567 RepID=UPI00325D9D6F
MLTTTALPPRPLARRLAPVASLLRAPVRADTWRRTAYTVVALPVAVASVPLSLVGGPSGRLQRGVARALLRLEVGEPARTGPRALAHALLATPLNLLILVITGYGWSLALLNLAYPARSLVGLGSGGADAWGGPTLAGAWAFHALTGGLGFLLLMPWVVKGLTWVQGRLVRGLLG